MDFYYLLFSVVYQTETIYHTRVFGIVNVRYMKIVIDYENGGPRKETRFFKVIQRCEDYVGNLVKF